MRDQRGFTLIEVIIAMVILIAVIAAMATATGGFVRSVSEDDLRAAAVQLADDRIQTIQIDPNYGGLNAYAGTETNFAGMSGITRTTTITPVTADRQRHTLITVVVNPRPSFRQTPIPTNPMSTAGATRCKAPAAGATWADRTSCGAAFRRRTCGDPAGGCYGPARCRERSPAGRMPRTCSPSRARSTPTSKA